MSIFYKFPIDWLTEFEDPEKWRASLDAETDASKVRTISYPTRVAEANIASCREALKAFEPIASPDLMQELTEAVDRYEDRVREFHGMTPRTENK